MADRGDWGDWGDSDSSGNPWGGSGAWGDSWDDNDSSGWNSATPDNQHGSSGNQSWESGTNITEPTPVNQVYTGNQGPVPSGNIRGLNPEKDVFVGIAQNVQSIPEKQRTFFNAWIDSLIYGVPFVNGKVRNVFNLQLLDVEDSLSMTQQRSIAVTFFGEANTGLISRGQTLQVRGRMGADRTVYATRIENMTNGSLISIDSGIPGGLIRVVTLLLLLGIIWLFSGFSLPGLPNLLGGLANINWSVVLVAVAAIALGLWWLYNLLVRPSRTTITVVGVILLFLLLYLVPSVGASVLYIVIICLALYWVIKNIFR